MLGISRSVSREYDITPSTTSSRLITTANTGRLIERSEMRIGQIDCNSGPASAGMSAARSGSSE